MENSNNAAGPDPLPGTYPDANGNGVPDYREPWLYRLGWGLLAHAIKQHPHTLAARALKKLEKLVNEVTSQK